MTQQGQMASSPLTDVTEHEALGQKLSGVSLGTSDTQQTSQQPQEAREEMLPRKSESTLECCADFALYPLGTTIPFASFIDEVERVLKKCGLEYKIHEHGTILTGNMMAVMYAIKSCHEAAHALGPCRILSNVRIDTGLENYRLTSSAREM